MAESLSITTALRPRPPARRAASTLAIALLAGEAPVPATVVLPGSRHVIPAPDGSGAAITTTPTRAADGGEGSPVFYRDPHGRSRRIATVTRSMGISWAPNGQQVFLQDDWGSDIADCYVLTRTPDGITGVSLLELMRRTQGGPRAAERPAVAHHYVRCRRWRNDGGIAGVVDGHTDSAPSHPFAYRFRYDPHARRIAWRR